MSPKVGPDLLPASFFITFTTAGDGGLPSLLHCSTYSVMRRRSVSSSTSRTMFSSPSPLSGLPDPVVALFLSAAQARPSLVPPVPSVMMSVEPESLATRVNSSAVMPQATSAAVIEPTEAPAMVLASFSTPLSSSAFTAPGSATPLPPPPEKVISRTGLGGAV